MGLRPWRLCCRGRGRRLAKTEEKVELSVSGNRRNHDVKGGHRESAKDTARFGASAREDHGCVHWLVLKHGAPRRASNFSAASTTAARCGVPLSAASLDGAAQRVSLASAPGAASPAIHSPAKEAIT